MGDFNYRVSMSDSDVRHLAEKKDYDRLLKMDQVFSFFLFF